MNEASSALWGHGDREAGMTQQRYFEMG